MTAPSHIQYSFNSGEWAPALNARVDLAKYKNGAALLQNYFVDYRGGASSRAGTKYILQAKTSSAAVRLIPFQASTTVGYILEFGDFYIRFYNNGAPVLETAKTITLATAGPPEVFTSALHGYTTGDWIFVENAYYIVVVLGVNTFTLTDLFGVAINTNPFSIPASAQRIYTIVSPYAASDLALVRFAQNVDVMILCHPNYLPQSLTLTTATSWAIAAISFGSTLAIPAGVSVATTLAGGTVNYAYIVTAVDSNGQESGTSTPGTLTNKTDIRSVAGSNRVTWSAVTGASSYNVYRAEPVYTNAVATGAQYGFVGNVTGLTFDDSNISPDFSQTPPIAQNPFFGTSVASITVTAPGSYAGSTTPTVTIAPPGGGTQATGAAYASLTAVSVGSPGNFPSDPIGVTYFVGAGSAQVVITSTFLNAGFWAVNGVAISVPGSAISGTSLPASVAAGFGFIIFMDWGVTSVGISNAGSGYVGNPAVTFSAGAATATSMIGSASLGNPVVPGFFQQRLVLAGQQFAPQTFYMSQPGSYYNFDTSNPIQADDAIYGSLVSGQLNTIKSLISQPSGLIVLSDRASWLINGGAAGAPVSPEQIVANAQSFNGASDIPPIVSNYDILFVQSKNSIVRDNSFNFYANVFTGTDISVLSSHLFYGYQLLEWAWAEEPFKIVWAIRNDGTLLSLTFLKEQEFIGWAHSITQGLFKSVATVTESTNTAGIVDAIYLVVERTINGSTVKYIERMAERIFPNGASDAWCVDAGLQYSGSPATSFSGGEHLAGATVVGLADGEVIDSFVMATDGTFTLPDAASKVTVGLGFTPALQTLALDLGEPTIQGKPKKIVGVTVRVEDTLGLTIGGDSTQQVEMKDLVVGNVSSTLTGQVTQVVSGLVTGDAYQTVNPTWTIPGQYYINQPNPLPSSILGVIPRIAVGDTK